jgi:hypothetical protein
MRVKLHEWGRLRCRALAAPGPTAAPVGRVDPLLRLPLSPEGLGRPPQDGRRVVVNHQPPATILHQGGGLDQQFRPRGGMHAQRSDPACQHEHGDTHAYRYMGRVWYVRVCVLCVCVMVDVFTLWISHVCMHKWYVSLDMCVCVCI